MPDLPDQIVRVVVSTPKPDPIQVRVVVTKPSRDPILINATLIDAKAAAAGTPAETITPRDYLIRQLVKTTRRMSVPELAALCGALKAEFMLDPRTATKPAIVLR